MNSADDIVRAIAILCWAVVIWRGLRARSLDVTWWACVLLAVTATVTITSNAQLLADVTTVSAFATLVANVCAVLTAALLLRWQALSSIRADHGPLPLPALVAGTGVVLGGLVATWLSAPHTADTPATHPAIALHWLVLHAALLVAVSVFGVAKLAEVRTLPLSEVRSATMCLFFAAACLGIGSALGVLTQAVALAGTPPSGPLPHLTALLQGVFVVLFLAGISLPLIRPGYSGGLADEVRALGSWLDCQDLDPVPAGPGRDPAFRLFPLIIEIRDRMWELQQHVDRRELAAASMHARLRRLSGPSARAFTAAVCLEIGRAARDADPEARSADPADLSRLGGGRTPAEEARWLAAITRVRRAHDVAAAARRITARSAAHGAVAARATSERKGSR